MFFNKLELYNNSNAVIDENYINITYFQLALEADAFAARIGVEKKLVCIESKNCTESLVAYIGCLRGRHPVLLLAPDAEEVNQRIIGTYKPDVIYRLYEGSWRLIFNDSNNGYKHSFNKDLAVLLSTSGSTGSAKLVRLSYDNLHSNAASIATYLGINQAEKAITSLPFNYSYGLSVINSHLFCGASLVMTNKSVIDSSFWDLFNANQCTSFAGVPYTFDLLDKINFQSLNLPSLRYFTQAGGRMLPEKVLRFANYAKVKNIKFFVMYGQTEATARIAYLPFDKAFEYPDCIGIAIPNGSLHLIDSLGYVIGNNNEPGQLVYKGPNVMMGYAQSCSDLVKGAELEELATGDLAYRNDAGLYCIVGRLNRFSKLFGFRISLDEIECYLREKWHEIAVSGDDESIVIGLADEVSENEIIIALGQKFKLMPSVIIVINYKEIPTLSNGKTDYASILKSGKLSSNQTLQEGEKLQQCRSVSSISQVFSKVFKKGAFDSKDTFISLGGDSITYVQVSMEIEKILGYIPTHWELETIGALEKMHIKREKLRSLPTEVLFRALAITGIIVTHATTYNVGGGADLLMLLAGYNLARFKRGFLLSGAVGSLLYPFFVSIVLPYYMILLVYNFLWKPVGVDSFLLVSNYFGRFGSFLEPFWFVEALFQCYLIFSVIFLFKPVRYWMQTKPWESGLFMLLLTIAIKCLTLDRGVELLNRAPEMILYLMSFGWCMYLANSGGHRILLIIMAIVMFLLFYQFSFHAGWLIVGSISILCMPNLKVPSILCQFIVLIGSASFHIYLSHNLVVHYFKHVMQFDNLPLIILCSFFVGIMIKKLTQNTRLAFFDNRDTS